MAVRGRAATSRQTVMAAAGLIVALAVLKQSFSARRTRVAATQIEA
jgi:hypothetical protein